MATPEDRAGKRGSEARDLASETGGTRRRRWLIWAPIIVVAVLGAFLLTAHWLSPPDGGRELAMELGLPHPAIIAHRGASYLAPEHSSLAFILARDMGAHYLECDIQRSRDGVLVVIHDENLKRTSNVAEVFPGREGDKVGEFTLDQLRRLDFGSWFNQDEERADRVQSEFVGLPILTLEELIDIAEGGWSRPGLYLETKHPERYPGIEDQIVQVFVDRGWIVDGRAVVSPNEVRGSGVRLGAGPARIVFQSFSDDSLRRLAKAAPGVKRVLLVKQDRVGDEGWCSVLDRAKELGCGVGPRGWEALWWYTGRAHHAGLVVHAYTIDVAWKMRVMRHCGVDGIFTNRPSIGLDAIGEGTLCDVPGLMRAMGLRPPR